jgi:16S rRNA (guanine527-N7)-methyltransferase
MDRARILDLLRPFLSAEDGGAAAREAVLLSAGELQSISTYIDLLRRWNARINLTAIRDEDEIVTRHFGESLFAADHLFPKSTSEGPGSGFVASTPEVADLGSGAGFPGIPIKLWAPTIRLTLIESNHKKIAFLREVARALTLTDINIKAVRAETLAERFDVLTVRAVERFDKMLGIAARLLAPSGRLALLIGAGQAVRAQSLLPALTWSGSHPVPRSDSRILLIGRSSPADRTPLEPGK